MKEDEILQRATEAFAAETGLRTKIWSAPADQVRADVMLDVLVEDRTVRFLAEIKAVDRFQTLGTIKAKGEHAPHPLILVAPYISAVTAQQCRELRLPFIDEAGNAYIEAPGLFIYITGKRRPVQTRITPAYRALTPAGLRIVFALLNRPKLADAPYRDIAKAARVALGTVGDILMDLEHRGHLAPEKPGPRRLLTPRRLQEEWITHYPIKLRPKLNARRFTAPKVDWWQHQDVRQHNACWGGEVAAAKITGYLKPATATIYLQGKPDALILANRLRPDVNGEVELLDAFWTPDTPRQADDVAPSLVIYADLMATADPRNVEAAKLIHDQYLATTDSTA